MTSGDRPSSAQPEDAAQALAGLTALACDRLPSAEGPHAAREALARFYAILDGLAPRHRTAFVLRHVEGLELTEVAAALDISLATIKRWLPRIARRVFSQAGSDPLLAPYLARGVLRESGGVT